jgi:hypothetical protein
VKSLGPYVMERKLGSGGMGVVYLARHPELGLRALKVIHTHLSDHAALVRFEREFQALAALAKHPHVVGVHTAGFDDGRLYYVMDAIEGEDLQARLDRGALAPRQAVELLLGVVDAVANLHAHGVVHRDLKPANILVGPGDHTFLTDFGLAKLLGDAKGRLTMTGELIGTPDYMAPEQALGLSDQGPPIDVYALGLILYAALAGQRALPGTTRLAVLQNAAMGKVTPLAESAPHAPQALAEWIERCLAKEPDARPSATELHQGLSSWLGSADTRTAGATQQRERTQLRLALAAVLLVLALGLGAIAAAVAQRRSRWSSLRDRAQAALDACEATLGGGAVPGTQSPLAPLRAELTQANPPNAATKQARDELLTLLAAVEAHRAARVGNAAAIAQALEEASAAEQLPREARKRAFAHAAVARAWLRVRDHVSAGDKADRALARELEKARARWPDRVDLVELQAELALARGQPRDAQQLLSELEAPSPPLRLRVALALEDQVDVATLLDGAPLPATLEFQALLFLAAAEVGPNAPRALEHLERAAGLQPLGQHPECEVIHQAAQSALASAPAGWGRGTPEELVPLLTSRMVFHALLDTLDPAYELSQAELGDLGTAILNVGPRLKSHERSTAKLLERAIRIGPERPAVYSWYARYATAEPDLELYRRALEVTDWAPTVIPSYARVLAGQGDRQALEQLCADFEARHGDKFPSALAMTYGALASLLRLKAGEGPDGSPADPATRMANLEQALSMWEKAYTIDASNRQAYLWSLAVLDQLRSRDKKPEYAARGRDVAARFLAATERQLNSVDPSLPHDVEYAARRLLGWSTPDELADSLALVDQVLSAQPLHVWLALRRLELAIERGEDAESLATRLELSSRFAARDAEAARQLQIQSDSAWTEDQRYLRDCQQALPQLERHLQAGELEEARLLLVDWREGLREDGLHRHPYGGSPRRL